MAQGYLDGTVSVSKSGSPFPGVNVVVKGTTNSIVTDVIGHNCITVAEGNSVLVHSLCVV